jgi:hypothetical protein
MAIHDEDPHPLDEAGQAMYDLMERTHVIRLEPTAESPFTYYDMTGTDCNQIGPFQEDRTRSVIDHLVSSNLAPLVSKVRLNKGQTLRSDHVSIQFSVTMTSPRRRRVARKPASVRRIQMTEGSPEQQLFVEQRAVLMLEWMEWVRVNQGPRPTTHFVTESSAYLNECVQQAAQCIKTKKAYRTKSTALARAIRDEIRADLDLKVQDMQAVRYAEMHQHDGELERAASISESFANKDTTSL